MKALKWAAYIITVLCVFYLLALTVDFRAVIVNALFEAREAIGYVPWTLVALPVLVFLRARTKNSVLRALLLLLLVYLVASLVLGAFF